MKWRVTPILIVVAAVGLASLACYSRALSSLLPRGLDEGQSAPNSFDACDARAYLDAKAVITNEEVHQDGTRACDYRLTFTNTHTESSIWPYMYRWQEDGYANTREGEWLSYAMLGPGKSSEWFGRYVSFTDPDAKGPYILEYQRIAGVIESSECQAFKSVADEPGDNELLKELSIPLPNNPCAPVK